MNSDGDFPGGPVVKNLPSNARDTGAIPGQGTKIPHTLGQLNPCMAMTKTCTLSVYALQYEKPQQREACTQKRRPSVAKKKKLLQNLESSQSERGKRYVYV